jgi:hypothetical protein
LGAVLEFAWQLYKAASFWEHFVWPYSRSNALVATGDGCWDTGVRRDIESMKPHRRELWLHVFSIVSPDLLVHRAFMICLA